MVVLRAKESLGEEVADRPRCAISYLSIGFASR